jgi:anti-anti-sigma factor
MELKKETGGDGIAYLRVAGHVDALTAPQLEKEIVAALAAPGSRCIVDLAQVEYMSSAGLRLLVVGAKAAENTGGGFAVFALQSAVRKVLAAVGFFSCIPVFETESEALQAVGRRPAVKEPPPVR